MKKTVYSILSIACCFTIFNYADAFTFTRTLSLGTTGQDVFELQKFLNQNPQTQISLQGAGSPGQETYFFGELTRQAVIKLQNLNSAEILTPVGLTQGTGIVGPQTLNFINTKQSSNTTQVQTPSITAPVVTNTSPQFLISKKTVQPNESISIGSQDIIKDTEFYLNSKKLSLKCFTDFTCEVQIDKSTQPGTYKLHTNNPTQGEYEIIVIDSSIKKPEINISSLYTNKENLITGKNFTDTIKIYTVYGAFQAQIVDNSFILEFPSQYNSATSTGFFYVENNNGLISDVLIIEYKI
jgi:hypothetical protein